MVLAAMNNDDHREGQGLWKSKEQKVKGYEHHFALCLDKTPSPHSLPTIPNTTNAQHKQTPNHNISTQFLD